MRESVARVARDVDQAHSVSRAATAPVAKAMLAAYRNGGLAVVLAASVDESDAAFSNAMDDGSRAAHPKEFLIVTA